jgi:peptidoglycan/xylan/chitin deacetylase (PgdA/CDA1 family)
MLKEVHLNDRFVWPKGKKLTIALSFDFQGGEGVHLLKDRRQDYEAYTQAEYGPHTGIWRILDILAEENVKATFFTCGAIAERFPEAVKAIAAAGHEVTGHGYHHETARNLERTEENEVMRKTAATGDRLRSEDARLAVLHAESQLARPAARARLPLQFELLLARLAVHLRTGWSRARRTAAAAVRRRPGLRTSRFR